MSLQTNFSSGLRPATGGTSIMIEIIPGKS